MFRFVARALCCAYARASHCSARACSIARSPEHFRARTGVATFRLLLRSVLCRWPSVPQPCVMRAKCAKCAKEFPSRKKLFAHLREAHELPGFQRRGRFSREKRQLARAHLHVEPGRAQPRRQHLPHRTLSVSVPPTKVPAPARSTSGLVSHAATATTAPSVAVGGAAGSSAQPPKAALIGSSVKPPKAVTFASATAGKAKK